MYEHIASASVEIPVSSLRPADSPRLNGIDIRHAHALAESDAELPAIVVSRRSMRVIDGMHRMRAAVLNRRERISVRFFDGEEDEAFLLAVEANIAHGLPLTLVDRRAAAERIIASHPQLADRSIARITALAAGTVRAIRKRTAADCPLTNGRRIGRDGRSRPLSTADGRRLAGQVLATRPDASLREIARQAGISVGTARDVRERVRAGEDPVPSDRRHRTSARQNGAAAQPCAPALEPALSEPFDPLPILDGLRRDPSLRYTDNGRALLRWLSTRVVVSTQWRAVIDDLPQHVGVPVSRIARSCADAWLQLAEEIERDSGGADALVR